MWWICLLSAHNCKTLFPSVVPELPTAVLTDASLSGGGCLFATEWMYANWALDYLSLYSLHINYKETFTTVLAAHRWAPFWSGHSNHQDRQSGGRSHSKQRLNLLSGDHGLDSFSVLA